ncbi:MAG: hypothetical protein QM586_15185, partial [Xenophilus sp.]
PAGPAPARPAADGAVPDASRLRLLEEAVSLGYLRGIMAQLDAIDAARPDCAPWTDGQRALARQFRFEAQAEAIQRALAAAEAAP